MPCTIESMLASDYEAVTQLWNQLKGLGNLESYEEFVCYLDRNPNLSTVARHDGEIVGAVFCGHDGRRGYLYHLAVAPASQNQGIARSMVERSLNGLQDLGFKRCSIHLYQENEQGLNFWNAIGWRQRLDLHVMAKDF